MENSAEIINSADKLNQVGELLRALSECPQRYGNWLAARGALKKTWETADGERRQHK